MAKGRYQTLYEDYQKRYGKGASKSSSLQKQINNYKVRLEKGGVSDKEFDDRNALEKLLNLDKNQGFIGDVFEVLNRPQQAIFGGIKSSQEGNSFGEGLKEGIAGTRDTQFKDILTDAGMSDRKGKLDGSDVLGFLGDVILDPVDLIPVAGFGEAAKVLGDTGSLMKAYKATDTASDLVFKGAGKAIKGGAKLTDKGIEKGLKYLDETKGIKYLDPSANKVASLGKVVDKGSDYANKLGSLELYKAAKEKTTDILKLPDRVKKARLAQRGASAEQDMTRVKLNDFREKEIVQKSQDFLDKQTNLNYNDIDELLSDVSRFGEFTMDRSIKNKDLLAMAKKGNLEGKQEFVDTLRKMVDNDVPKDIQKEISERIPNAFDITIGDDGYIKLGKGFNEVSLETKGVTKVKNNYTKQQIKQLREIRRNYANNVDGFADFVDDMIGTSWKNLPGSTKNKTRFDDAVGKLLPKDPTAPRATNKVSKDADQIGVINKANAIVDEILGTDLATKYKPRKNADYVLPHILTEQAQQLKGTPIGTKLLSKRKHMGSVDEVNNYVRDLFSKIPEDKLTPEMKAFKESGADFMETSILRAFDNRYLGKNGFIGDVRKTKVANEILLTQVFDDVKSASNTLVALDSAIKVGDDATEIARLKKQLNDLNSSSVIKYIVDKNDKIPSDFVKISHHETKELLKRFKNANERYGNKQFANEFKAISRALTKSNASIAINKDIARMMNIVSDETTINGLASLYNKYLNVFKKWKTSSPTFVINAFFGNSSNLALSGISPLEQAKYGSKVADIMQNGESYYLKRLKGGKLTPNQTKAADVWFSFRKMGFDNAALNLNEIPKEMQDLITGKTKYNSKVSKAVNFVPHINNMLNTTFDTSGRLVVMLKCMDDPSYMKKLGVNNVYDAISKVMFDPTNVTNGERILKNFIPFYTYAKNNLVFQATNIFKNPNKYNRLMKGMGSLQKSATGGNEENMADFIKSNLYIPIPSLDKDGNYTIIRATLPFGQLIETIESRNESLVGLLTPALKAPIEFATGVDSYTGMDIEKFPGEKSSQIPFLTKKQQKLLSDFSGLDVPLKTGSRLFSDDPLSTVVMRNNVDTDKLNRQYDELEQLQNLMKQYEQKGYKFSTMNELKKANKNTKLNEFDAIFNKYGIDTKTYAEMYYE